MTKSHIPNDLNGRYNGGITREPFLFHEMKETAKLYVTGLSEEEMVDRITSENLYQYPTEKTIRTVSRGCIHRLQALDSMELVQMILDAPAETAKQICLYAMMRQQRLVREFMTEVIANKYKTNDDTFTKMDMNMFFMNLTESSQQVASWSDATIKKIKSVLKKILVETGYLTSVRSEELQHVLLDPDLQEIMKQRNETEMLAAFNCLM